MKNETFCSTVILMLLFLMVVARAEQPVLVKEQKAQSRIIIPAEATRAEQFAAEELQIYLKKISGAIVPITTATDFGGEPVIIIGRGPAAKHIIAEMDKRFADNYDRLAVVVEDNRLFLTANSQSAIIWAVWDYLESLGVRWFFPGENGEYVPKLRTITLSKQVKYDAPALMFRGPGFTTNKEWAEKKGGPKGSYALEHGLEANTLWSYRMRFNNNSSFDAADSIPNVGSGHSYGEFLPANRYYKDHPEWFNLRNGKRQGPTDRWQVCFTNRQGAKEFARNLCRSVKAGQEKKGIPVERMRLFVAPNDAYAMCECDECEKLIDKDGSATSLVVNFANLVAEEVLKSYPKAMIVPYIYNNHGWIPDHVTPRRGVYPEIVFWTLGSGTAANHAHPMFSDANRRYRKVFNWFAENGHGLSSHTYYGHYAWFTPFPQITQLANDIPILAGNKNYYGAYSEIHQHWGTQGLTFYLYSKLMWNPDLDVAAAVDEYCDKVFGPAGAAIRQHYDILQKQMDSIGYIGGAVQEIPKLMTPEVIAKCNQLMDKVETMLPEMDTGTRWRTKLVLHAWRNSARFATAVRLLTYPQAKDDRETILRLVRQVNDFVETEEGKWAFAKHIYSPSAGVFAPLKVSLGKLPAGEHVFNDYFQYGGAIKFFADLRGFQKGLWGYSLLAGAKGVLELPIHADKGNTITKADVSFGIIDTNPLAVKLTVVGKNGKEYLLADKSLNLKSAVSIPKESLGGDKLLLRLEITSQYHNPQIILTSMSLNINIK